MHPGINTKKCGGDHFFAFLPESVELVVFLAGLLAHSAFVTFPATLLFQWHFHKSSRNLQLRGQLLTSTGFPIIPAIICPETKNVTKVMKSDHKINDQNKYCHERGLTLYLIAIGLEPEAQSFPGSDLHLKISLLNF